MYLVIAVPKLRMRAKADAETRNMPVLMWLYPWLT
ncbi:gamma-aminobutyrate transporter (fragment) [Cupriavidus metallidurans CH34]|uniref:Gamma-aminobutyrate transporter n=1 Tax=Cupriavidus metallidurans (strain ATCC 43123 / DSM 2839 / NBRC 102507 / CH34) TaxID=266264 RepID=Q1LMS5_CUPMC